MDCTPISEVLWSVEGQVWYANPGFTGGARTLVVLRVEGDAFPRKVNVLVVKDGREGC